METNQMKIVYAITERGERTYWTRIGVAYTNRDGSLNVKLDAVPVNGTMQVRDWTPREDGVASDKTSKRRTRSTQRSAEATLPTM